MPHSVPFLEILVSLFVIYLLPEGFYLISKRIFRIDQSSIARFVVSNIEGYLFGLAIAVAISFTFGVSHEQMMTDFVRKASTSVMRIIGMDEISICIHRTKEMVPYDPDAFVADAIAFDLTKVRTLDKRSELLAIANRRLIFRSGPPGHAELYDAAVAESCARR